MKQINFKNDVRITYDAKSKIVEVRWTDWEAAARGLKGNSRTKKRKIKVDEYTSRAEAEERLKIIAEKEQKDSIQRAQYLLGRVESGDVAPDSLKVPFATKFLRNLKDSQVTSSERERPSEMPERQSMIFVIGWIKTIRIFSSIKLPR